LYSLDKDIFEECEISILQGNVIPLPLLFAGETGFEYECEGKLMHQDN
jgi:hypothetical protein